MPADHGTFDARIRLLQEQVGDGMLTGTVERNQPYAQNQHETLWFAHPNGGQAKYQEAALFGHHRRYLQGVADHVLDGGIVSAMAEEMERLDDDSGELAPKDTTVLARSGHPVVRSAGQIVYDRAPQAPRLTPAEERAMRAKVAGRRNPRPGPGIIGGA